jgi:hypothetical protein
MYIDIVMIKFQKVEQYHQRSCVKHILVFPSVNQRVTFFFNVVCMSLYLNWAVLFRVLSTMHGILKSCNGYFKFRKLCLIRMELFLSYFFIILLRFYIIVTCNLCQQIDDNGIHTSSRKAHVHLKIIYFIIGILKSCNGYFKFRTYNSNRFVL